MKPSHRFVLLMLTTALLTLAISLPATNSAQAATSGQSAEDRIRATLEDAAAALGGGFEWETFEDSGNEWIVLERTIQNVGFDKDNPNIPVHLIERLNVGSGEIPICLENFKSWTFHGMNGCYLDADNIKYSTYWQPQVGLEIEGHNITLGAFSEAIQSCPTDTTVTCGNWEKNNNMGAVHLAEVLHQAAIKNGLYEPMPEEILPVDPGEVVPGQPEVPIEPSTPTETGNLFGIPIPIFLGSLGIPVAGAVVGAVLSTLLSGLSTTGVSSAESTAAVASQPTATAADPVTGKSNDQGLYWSERPWDEAGPGYVPKEEYERTKDMLAQGYQWTNGGWQTPDQIKESNQLQQNDRAAIAREDAKWRANREAEQQALEQNEAELKKRADELQAAENLTDLTENFESINQELLEQNTYVLNPYQGDPTVVFHRLNTLKNVVWDNTGGRLTGANGLTCEGYVDKTSQKTLKAVANRFPGAKVQRIIFEEKSTVKTDKSWGEWFDSLIDDNHNLTKIILPDGSEWALDFHQHNAGNSPLMRPWQETRQAWRKYMGDDFIERVSSETIAPKPRK